MPTSVLKTKLGKRLKALYASIPESTQTFYDLCCDHGALGRAVLERTNTTQVIFNDIHPDIMKRLERRLTDLNATNYSMSIQPAEEVILSDCRHTTVLLAGVGNEQCVKILDQLLAQQNAKNSVFIVSPATKVHLVRDYLSRQKIHLISESTVTENNRTYEIITFKQSESCTVKRIDPYGYCWENGNQDHIKHISKTLAYYEAKNQLNNADENKDIAQGYKKILKKITTTP
jgi:tRNA (adenine22-N1)-methyltransferase